MPHTCTRHCSRRSDSKEASSKTPLVIFLTLFPVTLPVLSRCYILSKQLEQATRHYEDDDDLSK